MGSLAFRSLVLVSLMWPTTTFAQVDNPLGRALESIFDRLGDKVGEKLGEEFDRSIESERAKAKIRKAEKGALSVSGYCQVWHEGSIKEQRKCTAKKYCIEGDICYEKCHWNAKWVTELVFQFGAPVSLNGKATTARFAGNDLCYLDAPADTFCFTAAPQAANLTIRDAPPAPIAQQSQTPQIIEDEPAASGLDSILDAYASAAERGNDPVARDQRCKLGIQLIRDHKQVLDPELEALIRTQLDQDRCTG